MKILSAFKRFVLHVFTHYKVFMMCIFVITAGQEFPLPEWLDITLGLMMIFTLIIWTLGQPMSK